MFLKCSTLISRFEESFYVKKPTVESFLKMGTY